MNNKKICEFIKNLRTNSNLKQEELAEKIYISRSNLSDIENGRTMLSPDKALSLSEIFNVSIEELYCGEKTNNHDIQKSNKVFYDTVNSIVKFEKKKSLKLLFIITLIFIVLTFLFLCYYFFYSYNSVKFYKVSGESNNFVTNQGMLIISKENINFSLSVESKNSQTIERLTLKYKDGDIDELIQQVDDKYFYITDYYNYNEYFDYKKIVKEKGMFYLEIEYENKKETLNLSTVKQYENKRLIFKKDKPVTDGKNVEKREVIIPEKILKEFKYEHNAYSYEKKLKDCTVYLGFVPDANIFFVTEQYKKYNIEYEYYIDSNNLYYLESNIDSNILQKRRNINKDKDYNLYNNFFEKYYNKYFE